ncbi:hypothetical protein NX059_008001 [Plenodomus lindquistii]|nr:hypothetical protein NX059_008001 [Plenodomus lindquistii]
MGDEYHHHRHVQAGRPVRFPSHYDMLQPRFTQSSTSLQIPPRDRYRVNRYHSAMYDAVEDEEPYDHGTQLDSFDENLLQQSYDDRQRCAAQGRGRLSLAPGPSRSFSQAPAVQIQGLYQGRDGDDYEGGESEKPFRESMRNQLSRFAYDANHLHESSSDMQIGPSSSPALRAGQRRADYDAQVKSQLEPLATLAADEGQTARQQLILSPADPRNDGDLKRVELEDYEQQPTLQIEHQNDRPFRQLKPSQVQLKRSDQLRTAPTVQGIPLVPIITLPDRLRSVFPYPTFNAVQSKCFRQVFRSDENFVLASPTGSGKTVILELAICRAVMSNATDQYKIVYQAPTKALCSERQRDWEKKFQPIGLKCAELTGDSDATDLRNVQTANIIITTPEKWDSMTRKWKDHEKLMKLIKLFLIDEVHILKEDRGAVLEVVSRTKSIAADVRFVALSATVPNFHDVATWLGKNAREPGLPAANEKFGEEFRPVKLQKHVCGFVSNQSNDFAFEKVLDGKLPGVIAKFSEGKPIMVFCATRKSTVSTAKVIANWWTSAPNRSQFWSAPLNIPNMVNKELRETITSGVAFHHAGLDHSDRIQIEESFISGGINVICCTSTLAVGVNLPCHLVIIKNTVAFTGEGMQEYSDLEMMQMLGRAGRPQFDNSAVAVIMTRQAKARRYEMMVTGEELLESKLHLNLIDHMNAEIGLGTISDLVSARQWLKGTFLYVRLRSNPNHYKFEGARSGQSVEEHIDDICVREITMLREANLASGQEYFRCTEFGHAMARYYVHFKTMQVFMGLEARCSPSEIVGLNPKN